MAQSEETQHNTLDQQEENQHNTLDQQKENQHNMLAQLEENQHITLAQLKEMQNNTLAQLEEILHKKLDHQEKNQSFLERFMLRPLAKFHDNFSHYIWFVINVCWTYDMLILHWPYAIDTKTRIFLALCTLVIILICAILGWLLNMIIRVFKRYTSALFCDH